MNDVIEKILFRDKYYFQKISDTEKLPEPDYVDNFVTDFSGWIYKCTTGQSSIVAMKKGKEKEKTMNETRIKAWKESLLHKNLGSNWRMIYNDLANKDNPALKISDLKIRNSPIYGKPDLIFVDDTSRIACIIEIKHSNKMMPAGGWPNARCQLWAYSKIDILKKYSKIYLVCENYADNGELTFINRTVAIDSNDRFFNEENQKLFDLYKSFENTKPTRVAYIQSSQIRKPLPQLPTIG